MDTNTLLRAAANAKVTFVQGTGWSMFSDARKLFEDKDLIEAKWLNNCFIPKNIPPDFKVETTYQDCMEWELVLKDAPQFKITLWDGHAVTGWRQEARCRFVFNCPAEHPMFAHLESYITRAISVMAHKEQDAREHARREAEADTIFQSYFYNKP